MTKKAEEALEDVIFTQISLSVIIISTSLSQLASVHDSESLINYSSFIFLMICELYFKINYANELVYESLRLTQYIGSSEWVNLSVKNRKKLILMQIRLMPGLKVKCQNWINLNLTLFFNICQLS